MAKNYEGQFGQYNSTPGDAPERGITAGGGPEMSQPAGPTAKTPPFGQGDQALSGLKNLAQGCPDTKKSK